MASSLPAFPPFEVHAETSSTAVRWKKWLRRFENMVTCLNIKDDMKRKRAMLLHYGGEELNDIFDTLPNTGEDHDYKAAIEALNSHFSRATNSEFSIYCFRQAKQQQDESLDTYHTRLQHLATPCDFDHKDKEIKTQIIQSCISRKLRRRALQQSDWPLKDLLDAGKAMELANKQAADIEQPLQNSDNLVNRIQERKSQHGDRQRRDSSKRKPISPLVLQKERAVEIVASLTISLVFVDQSPKRKACSKSRTLTLHLVVSIVYTLQRPLVTPMMIVMSLASTKQKQLTTTICQLPPFSWMELLSMC